MSADQFLQEVADRGWLSDAVLERVRSKVGGRGVGADSVSRFLVDKGHLTQQQVDELMDAAAPPLVEPLGEEESGFAEEPLPSLTDSSEEDEPETQATLDESGDSTDDALDKPKGKSSAESKAARAEKRKRERERRKKNSNEWESPLMLLGSAALILLLLCGFGVYYLIIRGSGDDLLGVADEQFLDGSYSQAIGAYEDFLEDYPTHEGAGLARVNLGLSRIRQALEAGNFELALERSTTEIPEMLRTEEFVESQRDLSAVLPQIATGLVGKADAAEDLDSINKFVALTNESLDLNLNNKYVPSQIRNKPEIAQVEEVLRRISRRQEALQALKDTLDTMRTATSSGDIRPAYDAHATLVKDHPELASREELSDAIAAAVIAEQGGVRFVDEVIEANTSEPASAIDAVVTPADQRRQGRAPASGAVAFQFQGVAYGLDAASGQLLWRRSLGDALDSAAPLLTDDGCLLLDARRRELVNVDTATGSLRWRTPLDEDLLQPVMLGDRVLVSSRSGRLHVVDATSGRRSGYLQFAQPLASSPVIDDETGRIYLVGEHSSVYTLSADDLNCLGVFYLGHAKGSVVAPPATVLGKVLVAENDGLASSKLRVLTLDGEGVVEGELDGVALKGLSPRAPIVFGRRLATVTNTGQITVFETSPQDASATLTEVAARRAPRRSPTPRYAALIGEHFWVAGHGLSKYSIQPAGNRLPKLEVRDKFATDVFVSPLVVRDGVVLHARRRRGEPGLTVTATNPKTGSAYWETDVAVPAAGAPSAAAGGRALIHATAGGLVYATPANAKTSITTPARGPAQVEMSLLTNMTSLDAAGSLATAPGDRRVLRIDAAGEPRWSQLPDGVACEPTRFRDGWLVPLSIGQVFYVGGDGVNAVPFQPELTVGTRMAWLPAGTGLVRGEPTAVVSNGADLYSLQLSPGSPARLDVYSDAVLDQPLTTRVTIAAEYAVAGRADGSLIVYDAESLDPLAESAAAAPIVWGPYAAGDRVLVARADGELACFDLSLELAAAGGAQLVAVWSRSSMGGVIGAPLMKGSEALLATRAGALHQLSLADGEVSTTTIPESLASPAVLVAGRTVLTAADGALLFVNL